MVARVATTIAFLVLLVVPLLTAFGTTFPFGAEVPWSDIDPIVTPGGDLIVLSNMYGQVMVYAPRTRLLRSWRAFGPGGSGWAQLALSDSGHLFVCGSSGTATMYSLSGERLDSWRRDPRTTEGWRLSGPRTLEPVALSGESRRPRQVAAVGDVVCADDHRTRFRSADGCEVSAFFGGVAYRCSSQRTTVRPAWWLWSLTYPFPAILLLPLTLGLTALLAKGESFQRTAKRPEDHETNDRQ
jgi:hypothetical protein